MHIFSVFALGKFKIGSLPGGLYQGVRKPYFEPFLPIFEILCLFLKCSIFESCYIWFVTSLEYPSAYVNSFALVKFKLWVYIGVFKSCFVRYCPFSEIFSYFFNIF